jgi:transposase
MSKRPRWNHRPAFQAKVVLAAIMGEKTLAEQFEVHPNQFTSCRGQGPEGAAGPFGGTAKLEPAQPALDVKTLHAKLGEVMLERNFFVPGSFSIRLLKPCRSRGISPERVCRQGE